MPTMHLLNTSTLNLERFSGESTKAKYAILSHRWGRDDEEASYQDLSNGNHLRKRGWTKIVNACGVARAQGYKYLWADTCCINKVPENNPEQTDALNAMYEWYGASEVCYAYLEDVEDVNDEELLKKSEWFQRGWTLQEMLAPGELIFFSRDWRTSVDRFDIPEIMNTAAGTVGGSASFWSSSEEDKGHTIDDILGWASRRKTTKPEDAAYSLIGMFKLKGSLRISYGEGGARAFVRLQEKLLQGESYVDDLTIFDWTSDATESVPLRSMFATSPKAFAKNNRSVFMRVRSDIFNNYYTILCGDSGDWEDESEDSEDESSVDARESVLVADDGVHMSIGLMELNMPFEQVGNATYELDLGSAIITDEYGVKKTENTRMFVSEENKTYYEAFHVVPSFRRRPGRLGPRFYMAFTVDMVADDEMVGILLVSRGNEPEKHRVIMNRRIGITRGSSNLNGRFSDLVHTDIVVV